MKINIKKLTNEAVTPRYATKGASGFDLHCIEDLLIAPGATVLARTGLAIDVGDGYEMQVRPRSGLSLKTSLRVANSPGTVDSDYRGEVCVIVWNSGLTELKISKGDRIAQGVICPVIQADIVVTEYLDDTDRGAGGFGSTGK